MKLLVRLGLGLYVLLLILSQLCGMSFGLMLSVLCDRREHVILAGMAAFFVTLLTAGVLWPLEGMPTILSKICLGLPMTLTCKLAQSLMFRELVCFSCADTIAGFLLPIAWSTLFIIMCIISVRGIRT